MGRQSRMKAQRRVQKKIEEEMERMGTLYAVDVDTGAQRSIPLYLRSMFSVIGETWGPVVYRNFRVGDKALLQDFRKSVGTWEEDARLRGGPWRGTVAFSSLIPGMIFDPNPKSPNCPFMVVGSIEVPNLPEIIANDRERQIHQWMSGGAKLL